MNTKTGPLTKGHNLYPWEFQQIWYFLNWTVYSTLCFFQAWYIFNLFMNMPSLHYYSFICYLFMYLLIYFNPVGIGPTVTGLELIAGIVMALTALNAILSFCYSDSDSDDDFNCCKCITGCVSIFYPFSGKRQNRFIFYKFFKMPLNSIRY
jgi:hypothetical protein